MEEKIKEYFREKNSEINEKLRASTLARDDDGLRDVMCDIVRNVSLVFGEVPCILLPFYALVIEALIPGMVPKDEDKEMLAALKKRMGVVCMTVRGKAFEKGEEQE